MDFTSFNPLLSTPIHTRPIMNPNNYTRLDINNHRSSYARLVGHDVLIIQMEDSGRTHYFEIRVDRIPDLVDYLNIIHSLHLDQQRGNDYVPSVIPRHD